MRLSAALLLLLLCGPGLARAEEVDEERLATALRMQEQAAAALEDGELGRAYMLAEGVIGMDLGQNAWRSYEISIEVLRQRAQPCTALARAERLLAEEDLIAPLVSRFEAIAEELRAAAAEAGEPCGEPGPGTPTGEADPPGEDDPPGDDEPPGDDPGRAVAPRPAPRPGPILLASGAVPLGLGIGFLAQHDYLGRTLLAESPGRDAYRAGWLTSGLVFTVIGAGLEIGGIIALVAEPPGATTGPAARRSRPHLHLGAAPGRVQLGLSGSF